MIETSGGASTGSMAADDAGARATGNRSSLQALVTSKPSGVRSILLYAQDSKGMGHVNRTLTIAHRVLAAYPNAVAFIATESPAADEFALPTRCQYVKLPTHWLSWADHEATTQHLRDNRSRLLREVVLALEPDLVLVDHEPVGHKGELRAGLFALKAQRPTTKFVFGLRDIMDDVGRIRQQWRELGVYEALEEVYDGIAVYGERGLYDVAEALALPPSVCAKLHYCGYLVREPPPISPNLVRAEYGVPPEAPLVVATVGGGSDGYPTLSATLDALDRLATTHADLNAVLVTGPFMPVEQVAKLRARAKPSRRILTRADNFRLVSAADAVVSMGGYNSVCEALCAGKPLTIVPRVVPKEEQRIRAEIMAAYGLARWVHPRDLNGESLARALDWALGSDPEAHARRVREVIHAFNGATQLSEYLGRWLGNGHAPTRPPTELFPVEQAA